jgi:uncharacterized protein YdeI (YjbR/CyaY-like superfamily)
MKERDFSGLKRDINPMPDDVKRRLEESGLNDAYSARPPYQRNDYLGWITRAKQAGTREKRIMQMLDELRDGGLYMKMKYNQGIKK